MNAPRSTMALGMGIIAVILGLTIGRLYAQPAVEAKKPSPFLIKVGRQWFNPDQLGFIQRGNGYLHVTCGGKTESFELGTDGEAEAIIEWVEARSSELKQKPVGK